MDSTNRTNLSQPRAAQSAPAADLSRSSSANNAGGAGVVFVIVLLILVNGLMLAGIFQPKTAAPDTRRGLSSPGEVMGIAAEAAQMAKARAAEQAAKAATPKPVAAKPAPAAKPVAAKPAPKSEPAAAKPAEPATITPPPASGSHAIAAGIFRSQKYLLDLEQRLTRMGLPHYRELIWKEGEAFRLTVADDAAARTALDIAGYEHTATDSSLAAYFHFEEEAAKAANSLAAAGTKATVEQVQGETPVWRLFVGPMDQAEAKEAVQQMKARRIEGFLIRRTE